MRSQHCLTLPTAHGHTQHPPRSTADLSPNTFKNAFARTPTPPERPPLGVWTTDSHIKSHLAVAICDACSAAWSWASLCSRKSNTAAPPLASPSCPTSSAATVHQLALCVATATPLPRFPSLRRPPLALLLGHQRPLLRRRAARLTDRRIPLGLSGWHAAAAIPGKGEPCWGFATCLGGCLLQPRDRAGRCPTRGRR